MSQAQFRSAPRWALSLLWIATLIGCRARRDAHPAAVPSFSSKPQPANTLGAAVPQAGAPLPPPQVDLPAERLHERVNGAAPWLQSIGCTRLKAWQLSEPSLELEVLVFDTVGGATKALDKDSAGGRSHPIPGDEGWTNAQVVYFRRGTYYCRLIAEDRSHEQQLMAQALRADQAILSGELSH